MTRLAMRFLKANKQRNTVLGIAIAVAVFGAILLESVGQNIVDQLAATAQQRYGTAQITLPEGVTGTPPDATGFLAGGDGWITEDQACRISEILQIESVSASPRIQSDAILVSDGQFATVRILSAGTEVIARAPGPAEHQSLLIGYTSATLDNDTGPGFVDLGGDGGSWVQDQDVRDLVWVNGDELMRALRRSGVAPEDAVGNVLLIDPAGDQDSLDDRSPAVIAYNSAEVLSAEFPGVVVRSRQDLAGRTLEMSAKNVTFLLSLVLILPAIAAIIGNVLVTAESRSDELVLLRTMGFDTPTIRALVVREVFMVAAGATLIALVSAGIVATAVPNLAIAPKSLVRFSVIGGFIPPGLSFLTARRLLSRGIHERLAEFRR